MEKTLTINISGWVFNINEDAFHLLTEYFKKLKQHFGKQDGGDEIVADIETRVAELFKEKIDEKETVINKDLVDEVMNIMGQPYQMEEDIDEDEAPKYQETRKQKPRKKLFRDTMNAHIAGVASGLGRYINLDPIIIRIIFLLLVPTGGAGIIIYLILWVLIPEAATTSDRIKMEGKKVNVENIENKVREETEYIKERLSGFSEEAKDVYHRTGPIRKEGVKKLESIFKAIGRGLLRFLKIILGIILFSTGLGFLITFALFFFNWIPGLDFDTFFVDGLSLPSFLGKFIFDTKYTIITLISLTILIIIPIIMLLFNGIRFIFNTKRNKTIGSIALQSWAVALIISIGMTYTTFTAYKNEALNITSHNFKTLKSDTLSIKLNTDSYYQDILTSDQKTIISQDDEFPIRNEGEFYGDPKLEIITSDKDKFELKLYLSANGYNDDKANINIQDIVYYFNIDSTSLTLDPYYKLKENTMWRNQDVRLTLFVPEGKTISIERKIRKHFRLSYNWRSKLNSKKEKVTYWIARDHKFYKPSEETENADDKNLELIIEEPGQGNIQIQHKNRGVSDSLNMN